MYCNIWTSRGTINSKRTMICQVEEKEKEEEEEGQ